MKYKIAFRIRQRGSPPGLYRLCRMLAPSGARAEDVKLEARSGESSKRFKIALLVNMCRSFGLGRTNFGDPGSYGYVLDREYEESDLDACELLRIVEVRDRKVRSDDNRDVEGRLRLQSAKASRLQDFGELNHWLVAADSTRQMLEQGRFRGVQFRKVVTEGPLSETHSAPYWELGTSITLPKLANTNRLMCYGRGPAGTVEPFNGDYSRMVFIHDPPYAIGEIHYARGDLQGLRPFDIAQTFEHLWIPQQSIVISNALYKLLRSRGVPVIVWPVRLDEGAS